MLVQIFEVIVDKQQSASVVAQVKSFGNVSGRLQASVN
jgi:hypothetical protein